MKGRGRREGDLSSIFIFEIYEKKSFLSFAFLYIESFYLFLFAGTCWKPFLYEYIYEKIYVLYIYIRTAYMETSAIFTCTSLFLTCRLFLSVHRRASFYHFWYIDGT